MENNNFVEILKVTWEFLIAGSDGPSLMSIEDACLISIGLVCTLATRRHMSRLASARRLQPATAHRLQQSRQQKLPPAAPLSAALHVASNSHRTLSNTAEPNTTDAASHAA